MSGMHAQFTTVDSSGYGGRSHCQARAGLNQGLVRAMGCRVHATIESIVHEQTASLITG